MYSSKLEGMTTFVFKGSEQVGRILPLGSSFHAKHQYRHDGAIFPTLSAAIEYVEMVDHRMDEFGVYRPFVAA